MNLREECEQRERETLSPYAALAAESRGREKPLPSDGIRTDFQRDRDRIIHCKAFRRLMHKTQVFLSPEGDHYRTRLTHTLEVAQIARTMAVALRLNENLTEAIALGHDLGHTPFGHAGERALDSVCPGGFRHYEQSLRVVDKLERDGEGLNLTWEVRDGILQHKKSGNPHTLEGKVVSLSDRIAYLNHDIDDAIRAGIITENDLPKEEMEILGASSRERINRMVTSIYKHSYGKNDVVMEADKMEATERLRDFMFNNVYIVPAARAEEGRAGAMLAQMYAYYKKHKERLPDFYKKLLEKYDEDTVLCDYLSSMTDRYAVYSFEEIFVPKNFILR